MHFVSDLNTRKYTPYKQSFISVLKEISMTDDDRKYVQNNFESYEEDSDDDFGEEKKKKNQKPKKGQTENPPGKRAVKIIMTGMKNGSHSPAQKVIGLNTRCIIHHERCVLSIIKEGGSMLFPIPSKNMYFFVTSAKFPTNIIEARFSFDLAIVGW